MAANQLFSFLFDVNLSCSCDNMWLAFDSKLSESITSSVRTTDNMKIPLLFFLDYEQTCTSDCPYTTRDVYSLPHDVFVSTKAFHHCLTSGRYTDQAVQRYFKDKCGYGTLRLSPNQLVMDHMHADSAVVCSREDLVKGAEHNANNFCPDFEVTNVHHSDMKLNTFRWCMNESLAVLSVNNVKSNISGWIVCLHDGFLPQATAIPLFIKGPPIFQHFQVKRKSKDELSVNFRLHSYPLPEFRLLTAKKGQNEWTDVLVTQNESRKLWLTKTLRSSADTITEGQILLHNQSPGNRYKFRACNPVDCDSIHFELSQIQEVTAETDSNEVELTTSVEDTFRKKFKGTLEIEGSKDDSHLEDADEPTHPKVWLYISAPFVFLFGLLYAMFMVQRCHRRAVTMKTKHGLDVIAYEEREAGSTLLTKDHV